MYNILVYSDNINLINSLDIDLKDINLVIVSTKKINTIFKNIVVNKQHRLLKRYLLISILVTTFLFSLGTSNSGTAIRHRAKMCSVVLVVWAISSPPKRGLERLH